MAKFITVYLESGYKDVCDVNEINFLISKLLSRNTEECKMVHYVNKDITKLTELHKMC